MSALGRSPRFPDQLSDQAHNGTERCRQQTLRGSAHLGHHSARHERRWDRELVREARFRPSSGQQLGAHRGAEAIGTNQEMARRTRTAGELRRDVLICLMDMTQVLAQVVAGGSECCRQHREQPVPGHRGLRTSARGEDFAGSTKHEPPGDVHAKVAARIDAELSQAGAHFRMGHDAGAAPRER
jgi:hypothetical protein